jgi:hypothetical protein
MLHYALAFTSQPGMQQVIKYSQIKKKDQDEPAAHRMEMVL